MPAGSLDIAGVPPKLSGISAAPPTPGSLDISGIAIKLSGVTAVVAIGALDIAGIPIKLSGIAAAPAVLPVPMIYFGDAPQI